MFFYFGHVSVREMTETLLLVDAYSVIYRAFYAIRTLTGPQGQPVNAIFGFTKMLRKQITTHRPTQCAVVFDLGAPKKRLAVLPSYKEHRPPTPPDLETQLPAIREILLALRVPIVELEGDEADDVIATLAVQAAQTGLNALIASNDKDFAQLVNERIRLLRPGDKEDVVFDAAAVEAKYGIKPSQIADYLSLLGDSVDNIPGVPGVGEKTAVELLRNFGNLDELLIRINEIQRPKLRDSLLAHVDQIRRNRQLVQLDTALSLPVGPADLLRQPPDYSQLLILLKGFGFKSLSEEVLRESQQTRDLFGAD